MVEIRHAVHDGLFTAYDYEESWGVAHRIMAPFLSKSSVQDNFVDMRDTAEAVVKKWRESKPAKRVDVVTDLKRVTLQAVKLCFFDQRSNCLDGVEPPMIKAMDSATLEAMKRPTRPKLLNSLLYQRQFDSDTRTMRNFGAGVMSERKAQQTGKKDMLNALMHAKDPETGKSLSEQQVIDEIITLCIGTATAPNLVAFALYYLLKNPESLTKACDEIDTVLGPTVEFTLPHLPKLQYCEACLRESIRLSAVAPGFNIEPLPSSSPNTTTTLANGTYEIPQNQTIIAILSAVNRDPSVFDCPEAFRPERMLGEAFSRLPVGAKKWFGNGKRECTGKLFGWQWSLITLICVLRGVRLELADAEYDLRMEGAFSVEPVGFFAFTGPRRNDSDAS